MLDWGGSGGRLLGYRGSMAGTAMDAGGAGAGYSLRWNNHQHHILNAFDALLQDEALVDVTLVCEEGRVRAHKVVLSACSPYFQRIFSETPCKHPVIVLKDLRGWEVQAIVDFMYKGEISVSQAQLPSLIRAAESLQVRGLAHMEKEQMSSSSAATMSHRRGVRLEPPGSPPVVSSAPLSSTRPYSPAPSLEKLGLYPGSGSRGTENGPLLMSSPFSPSPAPHFEPSPIKQSHHLNRNDNTSPPIHCRDPHRSSPLPRRKQARPRRRSGELSAHDLSKSSATSSPASSPSDIPENLCVKKQHLQPGSPPLHGHPSTPHSPRSLSSVAPPPPSFSPHPPSQPSSAPSLPHSPNTAEPPESPLTPSSNDMPHKAPSSLPADLTPGERLLDFSMNGSPASHPPSLGLTHPGSAPPHFSWVTAATPRSLWDPPLDSSGFPMLPSVSALSLTPPHVFSMESAQLGLFPSMDGCRNPLLNDLPESRHDNHILSKRKLGRPKGQHSAPRGGPPRSWTNAELTEALQHVWNKKMTTSQASRIFGIPYNSLLMYVRGKYGKSLKLEQLKKDCLVGAEMLSAPSPGSGAHHTSGGGRGGGGGDKNSDELSISSTGPEPELGFNPYASFYSDFAFPIPVSMIHLLPQSEKNREFPALDDGRDRDDGDESANEEDRKPTHNGQK